MEIHVSLQAEKIGQVLGLPVTNSLLLSLFTAVLLAGGGFLITRRLTLVPGKAQNSAELIVDRILDLMAQVLGDRRRALKFFPLLATLFLFILMNNWVAILPGIGSVGFVDEAHEFVPLFRAAAADLNTTFALAIVAVLAIQLSAVQKLGFFPYIAKYLNMRHGPLPFFVGVLELMGEFARLVSFSFRLFGNIFAGEVLLLIVLALLPLIATPAALPFFFLEYFVGFIQALVFAMLTLVFLKVAITEMEH